MPRRKQYLAEQAAVEVDNIWDDITFALPRRERCRYPGQQSRVLLDRIVQTFSNPRDVLLDPFSGTGTAIVAAQESGRRWIACDAAAQACSISEGRLKDTCHLTRSVDYVFGDTDTLQQFPVHDDPSQSLEGAFTVAADTPVFSIGAVLPIEETRSYEFKEVKGQNPVGSIKSTADQYAVAFLNSEGGRIFWGVRDSDHKIVGVRLSLRDCDEVRRVVTEKLTAIQPQVAPTDYRIDIHKLYQRGRVVPDCRLVEITVPRSRTRDLYFTGSNEAWVKTDGGKKRLSGPEIQQEVVKRQGL